MLFRYHQTPMLQKHISSKCHSKYFHRKVAELFGEHKIIKFKLRMYLIM